MTASSHPSGLPGLPVQAVAAGTVEPGDLMVGPSLNVPAYVWWRLAGDGDEVTLLVAYSTGSEPWTVRVDRDDVVLVVGRGSRLGTAAQTARLLAACRGGLWLTRAGHPQAPSPADLEHLLRAYARTCGRPHPDALAEVERAMPPLA